jgi:hypothetical protein
MLRWVTVEGKTGTGACADCPLVSEPLDAGAVAPSNQILGATLIFLGVVSRWISCTLRCVPSEGRSACLYGETRCVEVEG